jgi:histidine triad (HIT) family protein
VNDCIFCKIAAGQIKTSVVYENSHVAAFRDTNPQAPVHILVVPKKHIPRLSDVGDADSDVIVEIHKALRSLIQQERIENGYRVVVNEGSDGGQTVEHVHFHLLAGRGLKWPPG